jgi:GAF domain-containing protein
LNAALHDSTPATWRQILDLSERLMAQTSLADQQQLIEDVASRMAGGRAALWLSEAFYRPLGNQEPAVESPPTALMRQALETQHVTRGEENASDGTAAIALPLTAHGTALGVLEIDRPAGPAFDETEIELLDGLAVQSAVALHARRQVAVERWRVEQLALVRGVSNQVANVLDLDELARRVTRLISETFQYYYVALFTLPPGEDFLHLRAGAGRPGVQYPYTQESTPTLSVRRGEGMIGRTAESGEEILAGDVSRDPRYRYVDQLPETRSEVTLPLKVEDRVLGVLDVQSDEPFDFDETDMLVLRALADNIALAIEDTRLYGDLQRRARQLTTVADISRAIASILDQDVLFEEVVNLIHERFDYPLVRLFTLDPVHGRIVYRAGSGQAEPEWREHTLACSIEEGEGVIPWVACQGETALIDDLEQDPRARSPELAPGGMHAQLAVPLLFGTQVLGVLDLQSDRRGTFGPDDRFLFEALADNIAIAVRNANLYRSERWRRQVADSLRGVAGLLSSELALEQVLEAILTELERTLPCDAASIWLLEEDSLCLAAARGFDAEVCVAELEPDADTWLGQALYADRPSTRTPQSPPEPMGAVLGFPRDYSAVAAPLRAGDQRLGVLTLAHHEPGRYGTESRAMTAAFASYAAVAIENTRLYQSAQEQASISTVMLQVAEAARMLTNLQQVLETVVHLVPMLAGVDRCAVMLWDESAVAFVPAAAYGLNPIQESTFEEWSVAVGEEPAFDDLRLDKAPIFIYDTAIDPRLEGDIPWALGFKSLLLLPLLAQDEILGAMLIDYEGNWLGAGVVEPIHDERLAIIQGIAHQAAAAVESTQLREAQEEEAYVSAALLQVAQSVVSLNELGDILSTIVRIMPLLIGVEWSILLLWDEEERVFRPYQMYGISRAVEGALLEEQYVPDSVPLLDALQGSGELVIHAPGDALRIPGVEGDSVLADFIARRMQQAPRGPRPLLAIPLAVKGNLLGVMLVEETKTSARLREKRLEILSGIADQAALAIQNDRLQREMSTRERLERELQLAREIQQAFIPGVLPQLPGWDLIGAWHAARQVSGDFYDVFRLPGDRLAIVIADVADKGMPAALFMVLTRTLVRAAAQERVSPADVLARVNDLLVPDAQHGMFVTGIYVSLALKTGRLTYANAGHTRPFLLRASTGQVETLDTGGMALGVMEGLELQDQTVELAAGDSLVLYTDGVTEAFSEGGELYGRERLHEALQDVVGSSARMVLDTIRESVMHFAGESPTSDDVTLAVLHRLDG